MTCGLRTVSLLKRKGAGGGAALYYLDPSFWLVVVASGAAGTLLAAAIARVSGAPTSFWPGWRRLGWGVALFAPAPLAMANAAGPFGGFVVLLAAAAVTGREGIGPVGVAGEADGTPAPWSRVLTRAAAFATGSLATFYAIVIRLAA